MIAPADHRDRSSRAQTLAAACLIVLAVFAAYYNALSTPFVFDDQFAIVENPTIRDLAKLGDVLRPPPFASGAAGRPLVNLTLALNYAISGLHPWSYHALNVLLHACAALVFFGLLRRTLQKTALAADAFPIALAAATLWAVHPLLTESVTGVIQRNEILAGLLYLLTLYAFVRGVDCHIVGDKRVEFRGTEVAPVSDRRSDRHAASAKPVKDRFYSKPCAAAWLFVSVLACALGMAAKEIMVSAPLAVLLYDRTFVAGSFAAAWRQRRGSYLALAATWLLLAALMLTSQQRGGTVGFGLGVSAWDYLLTQAHALALYAKLSLWPHPLVIDYGTDLVTHLADVFLPGILILVTLAAVVAGVVRRSALGLAGAVFFAILAPSSSFVPLVSQPIAEHRMYLPLAIVIALSAIGLFRIAPRRARIIWPTFSLGLIALTVLRNTDYRSELTLTQSALAANPRNDRAYLNLGTFASREGRTADALGYYEKALALNPTAADTQFNFAVMLEQAGRTPEALDHFRAAVRLRPTMPVAQYRLGLALANRGQLADALAPLAAALRLQPESAPARRALVGVRIALGNTAAQADHLPEAISHYEAALLADPHDAQAHNNLANAFAQLGRSADAITHYESAVRERPDYAEAHFNLAAELAAAGRINEATTHLEAVLRLQPDDESARQELARLRAR